MAVYNMAIKLTDNKVVHFDENRLGILKVWDKAGLSFV